jgi:hypothetical protein
MKRLVLRAGLVCLSLLNLAPYAAIRLDACTCTTADGKSGCKGDCCATVGTSCLCFDKGQGPGGGCS